MKALLTVAAVVLALAGPALACDGTTEYPQTAEQLKQTPLTAERKAELAQALNQGWTLHSDAHKAGDGAKMGESMQMLRALQAQIDN